MRSLTRTLGLVLLAASACVLPACTSDGHLNILGYSSVSNYDRSIRTVYVPICKNKTMNRGIEYELHRAIVREILTKTPYLPRDCENGADTEILCTVINRKKGLINQNQLGEVRESEVTMMVEVYWVDLRPGKVGNILSGATAGQLLGTPKPKDISWQLPPKFDENGNPKPMPAPLLITAQTTYAPELGDSTSVAQQRLADKAALQIVSMMEVWR